MRAAHLWDFSWVNAQNFLWVWAAGISQEYTVEYWVMGRHGPAQHVPAALTRFHHRRDTTLMLGLRADAIRQTPG